MGGTVRTYRRWRMSWGSYVTAGSGQASVVTTGLRSTVPWAGKIKRVIIIYQENRSFDNQYVISGTSTIADGSPLRAAENPLAPGPHITGGCDSPPIELSKRDAPATRRRRLFERTAGRGEDVVRMQPHSTRSTSVLPIKMTTVNSRHRANALKRRSRKNTGSFSFKRGRCIATRSKHMSAVGA